MTWPDPPVAPRRATQRSFHGDVFVDPYAWMRDKSSPQLRDYLTAENAYTEVRLAHLTELRRSLFDDIAARTQETDLTVPEYLRHTDGRAFWYFTRTTEGREYPVSCRMPATDPDDIPRPDEPHPTEQVILDGNLLAAGHAFLALGAGEVSPNGNLLAYSVDHEGDEQYHLHFRDLTAGTDLPDDIPDVAGGGCWLGDEHFLYLMTDDAWRPFQVWRHRIGTPQSADVLVYEEPDERFWLGVDDSRDRRFALLAAGSKITSEFRLLSASDPEAAPRLIAERREGVEYDVEIDDERMYLVHNDGAEDFALAWADLNATGAEEWHPLWPGEPGVRLLAVSSYRRALICSLRRHGLTAVRVIPRTGTTPPQWSDGIELAFDEPMYSVDEDPVFDPDTQRIRLSYESMVTPRRILDYHLTTGERRVLKEQPVRDHPTHGPYNPQAYVQERLWADAPDGTRVPISLVRRADTALDGNNPCLLYGYGAYEISLSPAFSISRLSLLDRGFVVATAHVRGGGELGRSWYRQGTLLHKRNSFLDFIAAAHHLVAAGYTSPDRLVAQGRSAGGLLMGAVANMAPESFAAIHADVPFVDALTTILDPSLPLTVTEWDEWGDPVHDAAIYAYMRTYSPYENIRPIRYPAILATTSLNDTRVEVTEPAKWVAALRHTALNGPDRPILLKTEMVAGHGGVSGRHASWRDIAFELAWMIDRVAFGQAS